MSPLAVNNLSNEDRTQLQGIDVSYAFSHTHRDETSIRCSVTEILRLRFTEQGIQIDSKQTWHIPSKSNIDSVTFGEGREEGLNG